MSSEASPRGVPLPLQQWIQAYCGQGSGTADASPAACGANALRRALELEDRDRAFALLAADALLTLECEHAAADEDPEGVLLNLLDSLGKVQPR